MITQPNLTETNLPPWPKLQDIARAYGVAQATARRWRKRGLLPTPAIDDGGIVRWRRADVEAALAGSPVVEVRA